MYIYILVATHFSSTLHSFSILSISYIYIVYLPVKLSRAMASSKRGTVWQNLYIFCFILLQVYAILCIDVMY